jgi:hypothetical protein
VLDFPGVDQRCQHVEAVATRRSDLCAP